MTKLVERACPACASDVYFPFASERIDQGKVTKYTYASRKTPEFMRLRLVRCSQCKLVYAPVPPGQDKLFAAYSDAAYDSAEEASFAARTYARILTPHLARLIDRNCAVDIGAGNGALLPLLRQLGFATVVGIEPSHAAIAAAEPETRLHLREAMFSAAAIADLSPSLIVNCMTLEHVDSPKQLLQSAYAALAPGGMCAVVVHNRSALINRLLGMKSPVIDIEHLQLFCPDSIRTLLESVGFADVRVESFANTYPLRYWVRLLPLPLSVKVTIQNLCARMGITATLLTLPVGNILGIGMKSF